MQGRGRTQGPFLGEDRPGEPWCVHIPSRLGGRGHLPQTRTSRSWLTARAMVTWRTRSCGPGAGPVLLWDATSNATGQRRGYRCFGKLCGAGQSWPRRVGAWGAPQRLLGRPGLPPAEGG